MTLAFVSCSPEKSWVFSLSSSSEKTCSKISAQAYYAVAPFIGVALSFLIFREIPGPLFFIALVIMIAGVWMVNKAPRR